MKTEIFSASGELDENSYVITDEETGLSAVIDPDFTAELPEFDKLQLILLTHAHFDHILSAEEIRRNTGAKICIMTEDSEALMNPNLNLSSMFGNPLSIKADRLLSDKEEIMLGKTLIEVIATPGHTQGGCCYYADNTVFTGDTLMRGTVGRTDFPTGSYNEIINSIRTIAALPEDTLVLPGHGEATNIGWERGHNPYLGIKDSNDSIY